MTLDDLNKLVFIEKVLGNWSRELEDKLLQRGWQMKLYDRNSKRTEHLLSSFHHQVKGNDNNAQGRASFSFAEWGRMLDMGAGRMKKFQTNYTNGLLLQQKGDKKRMPQKFYSKTAYGMLNRLMYELSQTYTEATVQALKKELQ